MEKEIVYEVIFKLKEGIECEEGVCDAEVLTVYEKDDLGYIIEQEMESGRFSSYEVYEVEKTYKLIEG